MAYEFEGKTIETATSYLVSQDGWSKKLAQHIAEIEQIALMDWHWDVIDYLGDEYFKNNQNTHNFEGGAGEVERKDRPKGSLRLKLDMVC